MSLNKAKSVVWSKTRERFSRFPQGKGDVVPSKTGFTLIELLVVVAILGILAALLFPILFQGRMRARQTTCRSNMQQLGRAFGLYVDDWDGVLPVPGGLFGERNYWDQGGHRGLDAYLSNRTGTGSVWACPELEGWNSRWEPRTYTMNTMLRDPPDTEPYTEAIKITEGLPLTSVQVTAETVLLFEGTQTTTNDVNTGNGYVFRDGDWTHVRGYWKSDQDGFYRADRPWHGGQNNYLFVDGHVKSMPPDIREPDRPVHGRDLWRVDKNQP